MAFATAGICHADPPRRIGADGLDNEHTDQDHHAGHGISSKRMLCQIKEGLLADLNFCPSYR